MGSTATGQHLAGIRQLPCVDADSTVRFIGDHFGLAISRGNVYPLFVSTHDPSNVNADEGGPVYYQRQVLATVLRSNLGT